MHTASMTSCVPVTPIHIFVSYVQPTTQQKNQELYENHLSNQNNTTMKNINGVRALVRGAAHQLLPEKCSIHYASLSAMLNPLHSSTNQELF